MHLQLDIYRYIAALLAVSTTVWKMTGDAGPAQNRATQEEDEEDHYWSSQPWLLRSFETSSSSPEPASYLLRQRCLQHYCGTLNELASPFSSKLSDYL